MMPSPRRRALTASPDPFDGVLLVDKPSGMTSHDVVDSIRRHFRFDKVGHAGTLDPQGTGLLVLMLGRATKLADSLMGHDKTYLGTLRLGVSTDTQDAEGRVLREADPSGVTAEALRERMGALEGDLMHTPPMVSAVKKDGVPLYKLARAGKTVERTPKLVHIYEFRLTRFESPRADFLLRCSKGVYVRTLCAEIGDALGCGAMLEALRRTRSGPFSLDDALPLAALRAMTREELKGRVIPLHRVPV
jgi:tRNA pseudouridine55 synthase